MPITYTYDPDAKIILEHPNGIVSLEDIAEYFENVWNDSEIPVGVIDIVPFHEVEDFSMKQEDTWKVQEVMNKWKSKKKYSVIIFVANTPFHQGMARMFQSIIEGTETATTHIVESNDDAFNLAKSILQ